MGRKSYISHEKKVEAVEKYLRGEGSQESIAREYGITRSSFRQWCRRSFSLSGKGRFFLALSGGSMS